jgi:hypothetical protein
MAAARISVGIHGRRLAEASVQLAGADGAPATADAATDLVAYYRSHAELVSSIRTGLRARGSGDEWGAAVALGHASEVAGRIGHEATLQLLHDVIEDDADTGTVRVRRDMTRAEELELATRSVRTVHATVGPSRPVVPERPRPVVPTDG